MSAKERDRLEVLGRVKREELTVVQAAGLLEVSVRQARRIWKRFGKQGAGGLVHGLRGKASNRRLDEEFRQRVLKRHQERYADFGPTFACEKLAEEDLLLSPDTLVAILKEHGLWVRHRRRGNHRKRRERRASFGSLLQMDGSHHDWFEGRRPWCVLMVLIDDATNRTYARFYEAETTEAAFDAFGRWVKQYGLPRELYVDRHSIYRDQDHPQAPTQFGRAMRQVQVKLICAHSPQAKGRVERRHALFQDRLVKELRLRNISDLEQANALLEQTFLEELNRCYALRAAKSQDLHRPLEAGVVLEEILCVQEERVVGRDWCLRWQNRWLQIEAAHAALNLPGRRVLVRQLAGGALRVEHQGQRLSHQELATRPAAAKERKKKMVVNNRRWTPPTEHPWRKGPARRRADPRVSLAPAAPARDLHAEKTRKAG